MVSSSLEIMQFSFPYMYIESTRDQVALVRGAEDDSKFLSLALI